MTKSADHTDDEGAIDPALNVAGHLLHRLIGIVGTVIALGFLLVMLLAIAYLYFVLNPHGFSGASAAASQTQSLLLSIWQGIIPLAGTAIRIAAPVLMILAALILLAHLARKGAVPLDLSKITSDLPSFLAIIIILTICLLPLSGLEVPGVLNNIALVVVGFYFGKREAAGSGGARTSTDSEHE